MSEQKTISGKVAIIAMLVVALGLTAFAWWYRYQQGRRAMEFWGPEAAQLIRHAPKVELLEFWQSPSMPTEGAEEWLQLPGDEDGEETAVIRATDLSHAPGLVHARHSLIVDRNFSWEANDDAAAVVNWDIAWRFSNSDAKTIVLFDDETGAVCDASGERTATLHPEIARGMRDYISRQGPKAHSE